MGHPEGDREESCASSAQSAGIFRPVCLRMKRRCMGKNKRLRQHQMLVQGTGWFKGTEGAKFGEVDRINPQVSALI